MVMKKKYIKWITAATLVVALSVITIVALTQQNRGDKRDAENDNDTDEMETAVSLTGGTFTNDNAWEQISKVAAVYTTSKYLNVNGTVDLYSDDDEPALEETLPFSYEINGKQFFNKIGPAETIFTGSRAVYVDHEQKTINIWDKNSGVQNLFSLDSLKTLMKNNESTAQVLAVGAEKIIALMNISHPSARHILIYYSTIDYHISKAILYLSEFNGLVNTDEENETDGDDGGQNPKRDETTSDTVDVNSGLAADFSYYKMVINYKGFSTGEIKTVFQPELKYLSFEGKEVKLKEPYKEYEVFIPETESSKQ
jgi:hypothetical protein